MMMPVIRGLVFDLGLLSVSPSWELASAFFKLTGHAEKRARNCGLVSDCHDGCLYVRG